MIGWQNNKAKISIRIIMAVVSDQWPVARKQEAVGRKQVVLAASCQ
jgi:hypothetical protein